jgi:hypothetical protein
LGPAELVGNQVDLGWAAPEQQRRVQVGVAGPDTEVEPVPGGADRLALGDLVATNWRKE